MIQQGEWPAWCLWTKVIFTHFARLNSRCSNPPNRLTLCAASSCAVMTSWGAASVSMPPPWLRLYSSDSTLTLPVCLLRCSCNKPCGTHVCLPLVIAAMSFCKPWIGCKSMLAVQTKARAANTWGVCKSCNTCGLLQYRNDDNKNNDNNNNDNDGNNNQQH